jgi:hypothetical protein
MKLDKLKQLIKEEIDNTFLNEKVGVPDNITIVASQIFQGYMDFLQSYPDDMDITDINGGPTIDNSGKGFDIADLHLNSIYVGTELIPHSELAFGGMAIPSIQKFASNSNLKMLPPKDLSQFEDVSIRLIIATPPVVSIEELMLFLLSEKPEIVSSFAHELKHWYDGYKNIGGSKAKDRAQYYMSTHANFGDVTPINDFFFALYFMSGIESLVRPSELASEMEIKGVTRKEFYDFLTQSKVFTKLKDIRDWTYDGFRAELKNYIPQIKSLLRFASVSIRGKNEDQLIDDILTLVLVNATNWHSSELAKIVSNPQSFRDMIDSMLGKPNIADEDIKAFDKQIDNIQKFGKDYEKYFKYNEKLFRMLADGTIKRISKTYSLIPSDEELTEVKIANREAWYKTYGYKGKLDTKLKRPKLR